MNRHSLRACVAVLAALFALVASAQTQSPPAPVTPPKAPAAAPARKAPKAAPPPVTSLDVTVTDPAGKPVEGAFVMALPVAGRLSPVRRARAGEGPLDAHRPGGEGEARVAAAGAVERHRARPRPRARSRLPRVASGPLAVRLEKGGSITGVVREGRGSRPVAGARVSVSENLPVPGGWEDEATRNETTTDAKGRFRIDGIGRAPVGLVARAPGFDEARREARSGEAVELFLFPGATLAGIVRDDEGRPVKGAAVWAEGDRPWRTRPPSARTRGASSGWRVSGRASTRWWPARAGAPPGSPRSWSSPRPRPACRSCSPTAASSPAVSSIPRNGRWRDACAWRCSTSTGCRPP